MQLTFAVRSHGQRLADGLAGFVEARSGSQLVRAKAEPKEHGSYSATLLFPQAGEWQITVDSGYSTNGGGVVRFPLTVVAEGETRPVLPDAEHGRRLFVVKGCMTCHVHASAPSNHPSPVGPILTGKRYPPDYLRRVLADPSFLPGAPVETSEGPSTWKMPNLDLARPKSRLSWRSSTETRPSRLTGRGSRGFTQIFARKIVSRRRSTWGATRRAVGARGRVSDRDENANHLNQAFSSRSLTLPRAWLRQAVRRPSA